MPYTTDWEPNGVCSHFTGFVTAEEYVRSAEDICADPRFDTLRFVIKNLAQVQDHSIHLDALEPIAAIRYGARYTNPNIRLLFITSDPKLVPFAYPSPRSFLRGLYDTRAFPDMDAARHWLAAQPPITRLGSELGP